MNKDVKTSHFDPEHAGMHHNQIFGLPTNFDDASLVILPVPWDVTSSFRKGSAMGPEAILHASKQTDLFSPENPEAWKQGIYMLRISDDWQQRNHTLRPRAMEYAQLLEHGADADPTLAETINTACEELRKWVFSQSHTLIERGKKMVILGGEHSVILGALQALAARHSSFGILQIDAHADLREAYMGIHHSHASIMHNALAIEQVQSIIQVGVRDLSPGEAAKISNENRVHTFYDWDLQQRQFHGDNWHQTCEAIIQSLPDKVYISFDIDGLEPSLCPNTGTPVPGGLRFEQAVYLVHAVRKSGRSIIGMDLNEVAPGRNPHISSDIGLDEIVGAQLLYRLCAIYMAPE